MPKFKNILTLHGVMLIVIGCWKKTVPTHILQTTLHSLISRKQLMIVNGLVIISFIRYFQWMKKWNNTQIGISGM